MAGEFYPDPDFLTDEDWEEIRLDGTKNKEPDKVQHQPDNNGICLRGYCTISGDYLYGMGDAVSCVKCTHFYPISSEEDFRLFAYGPESSKGAK